MMLVGLILLGAAAGALLVLIVLAGRKLLRGEIQQPPPTRALEAPTTPEDDALAREALGEIPPEGEPEPGPGPEGVAPEPVESVESVESAYRRGLARTKTGFMARINSLLFAGRTLDRSLADELEEILVTSDIGIRTAERLLADLKDELSRQEIRDPEAVRAKLKAKVLEIVRVPVAPLNFAANPLVIMVIGVNGVGKTTTIGKLAARFRREGKKVVLAAGDTFRAAAVEQLEIWAQRSDCELVKGPEGSDPASVAFEAIQAAKRSGAEVCIADTAGRLHTKVNLMEELKKLRRVMEKAMPGAPHEVLLVLDATTGQNAITQAQQFTEAVQVSSLALTKLDGTAKGGVVVAVLDALGLPVRFVGVGERIDDLRDFDAGAFVDALFERDDRGPTTVDRGQARP
ncbi:MAG: signal recognition particle-docking protein FtsY [Deltaproteobacteria bacterium]|nr:signal recognition particle-docking protein FtsY [Deltaproteobacteria bacterium]